MPAPRHLGLLLFALGGAAAGAPAERVVSLDYCADQYLLELLPKEHILALSPDAEADFSYLREAARGLPTVRPVAEDVLVLEPELVVRTYGGGPRALEFFAAAGIAVLQVPYAEDLAGVREAIRTVAAQLGVPGRGDEVVARMNERLAAIDRRGPAPATLYVTAGGATTGPGTLVHEMLEAAGLANFETRPGWHSLPLEALAYAAPDLVAAAFFDTASDETAHWSSMRHPVARRQLADTRTVWLPGATTACNNWALLDAIEALAAAPGSAVPGNPEP